MQADLLSDSFLYIVSYMRRLLVEQQALEHVPCADCDQCQGPRAPSQDSSPGGRSCPAWAPAPLVALSTRIA